MADDLSQYKDLYVSEVEENIAGLSAAILLLEKDSSTHEAFDSAMRLAHTIKGSSAAMGYHKMAFLAHVLEDVFSDAMLHQKNLSPDHFTILLQSVDGMKDSLDAIVSQNSELDTSKIADKLKKLTGVKTEGVGKSLPPIELPTSSKQEVKVTKKASSKRKIIQEAQGEKIVSEVMVASELSPQVPISSDQNLDFERRIADISYIKVPVSRLDVLMGLMEEMLSVRMKLQMIADPATRHAKDPSFILLRKAFPLIGELHPLVEKLNTVVTEAQYEIMRARMVPVGQIFGRFPRMIRDLALAQQKEVDFVVEGNEIELDRSVVDKLGQPLIHLLRNALDHGILKKGTIQLTVRREHDHALVTVEDNGMGLDKEAIRKTIVLQGLMDANSAEQLTEKELFSYIFRPHFTTSAEVTEISGRGVGLSAVKGFVEEMGGRIMVYSPVTSEGGTRFVLRLPFSVAIITVLLVRSGGQLLALPFSAVEHSVRLVPEDIHVAAGVEFVVINTVEIPIIRLVETLDLGFGGMTQSGASAILVLVRQLEKIVGIVVDVVVGREDVVVKTLPKTLQGIRGISGVTTLGDGRTVLILDIPNLLELALAKQKAQ